MTAESARLSIDEVTSRLDEVVLNSPADQTQAVWLEVKQGRASHGLADPGGAAAWRSMAAVRVQEGGREGIYRTGSLGLGDLQLALRMALAHARTQTRQRTPVPLPTGNEPEPVSCDIFDLQLAELDDKGAHRLLAELCSPEESARLDWAAARLVLVNSRELHRAAVATAAGLELRCRGVAQDGRTVRAARHLDQLRERLDHELTRERRADELGTVPTGPLPLVLSEEAMMTLVGLLNEQAFTAQAYRERRSFLRQHLGVQVFDRRLDLIDDATDPAGLPFPFDLEGKSKMRVELIASGVPRTPALDLSSAAVLGLAPTHHAVLGEDAFASNLFVSPGELSNEELLGLADGGVFVGWLEAAECDDPERVRCRCRIGGGRRIRNGRLAEGLAPLIWEDSLLRAFSSLLGLGRSPAVGPGHELLFGGVSAPAVVLGEVEGLVEERR